MRYKIYGYTFEADIHCPECTAKRFNLNDVFEGKVNDRENNPVRALHNWELNGDESCGDCHEMLF